MNTKTQALLKRRQFLNTATGSVAFGAFFGTVLSAGGATNNVVTGARHSPVLDQLLAEMEAQGNRFMSVPRAGCQLLQLLAQVGRTRRALELGTSQGYSTLWLALALEESDGKLTTIDMRAERIQIAKDNLAKAGLAGLVTFLEGDAHKLVSTLDGPFDFVFLDADKPSNFDYFQKLYPNRLSPGALLVARKPLTMQSAMANYLDAINQHPDFHSVIVRVPNGDDFSLAYRRRSQ